MLKTLILKNQKGQGLIEYLIIVALVGIAAVAATRSLQQSLNAKLTTVNYVIRGSTKKGKLEDVDKNAYEKKDFSSFMEGAVKGKK